MRRTFQAFLNERDGATAIEYALMAAMFALAAMAGARMFGDSANDMYAMIAQTVGDAMADSSLGDGGGGDAGGGGPTGG